MKLKRKRTNCEFAEGFFWGNVTNLRIKPFRMYFPTTLVRNAPLQSRLREPASPEGKLWGRHKLKFSLIFRGILDISGKKWYVESNF
ncbi:MAG: hypothetical protein EGQ10_01300 [Clostridiales bacterium]|nr:hypothetical protein [Clostridiales bacterium]